jgi:hypothetical protein
MECSLYKHSIVRSHYVRKIVLHIFTACTQNRLIIVSSMSIVEDIYTFKNKYKSIYLSQKIFLFYFSLYCIMIKLHYM